MSNKYQLLGVLQFCSSCCGCYDYDDRQDDIHTSSAYFWTPVVTPKHHSKLIFYFCFYILYVAM